MVLYVFVVAYIGGVDEPLGPELGALRTLGPLFAAALGVELCIAFIASGLDALDSTGADIGPGFGSPAGIGQLLLTRFLVAFEAASFLLLIAAVGAIVLARGAAGSRRRARRSARRATAAPRRPRRWRSASKCPSSATPALACGHGRALVDIVWYLVLSAFIFCIGAAGVLTRRNPLVVLLCLELMLNAGSLALVAFSRMRLTRPVKSSP